MSPPPRSSHPPRPPGTRRLFRSNPHRRRLLGLTLLFAGFAFTVWAVYDLFGSGQSQIISTTGKQPRSAGKLLIITLGMAGIGWFVFKSASRDIASSRGMKQSEPSAKVIAEIRNLLARGYKVSAVRTYRRATGAKLSDATKAVEKLADVA